MKAYFFRLSKTKKWLLAGGFFIVVLAAYFLFFRGKGDGYDLATVVRQDLTEDVAITGNVKADERVILSFERTGRVSALYAEAGDRVVSRQLIAVLGAANE